MVSRTKPSEEKSKPKTNFILYLPIRFDISGKQSVIDSLDYSIANQNKSRSEAWLKMMFELLNITESKDLVKDKEINRKISEIRTILDKRMNIPPRERSKFLLNKMMEKYLKGGENQNDNH